MATPTDVNGNAAVDAPDDLQTRVTALFDDEAAWDAGDTDAFLLHVIDELGQAGADVVSLTDGGGNSLLHAAALWNRPVIMEALVRRGAELNAANTSGHTPMDLAMHWGHADLAQQLRHYGGKHSCEKERDLAVAQRDLARRQAHESAAELEHAASALRQARHEREALRVERDRVQTINDQVLAQCEQLEARVKHVEIEIEEATKARNAHQVRAEHLASQLESEKAARGNALTSWKAAEAFASDLQQQVAASREREEEALAMRNEAIKERELARELARQAHLDQGLATQNQRVAEHERDKACSELLTAEREVAAEKERCQKQLTRVEAERRNIQVEIDRQTHLLRAENAKLEKTVRSLNVTVTRQREELERGALYANDLKAEVQRIASERDDLAATCATLQQRVDTLEQERRDAHRAYRERMEAKLKQQYTSDAKNALQAVFSIWSMLQSCLVQLQQGVGGVKWINSVGAESCGEDDGSQSPCLGLARSSSSEGQSRPQITTALASNGSDTRLISAASTLPTLTSRPVVLPFLRDSVGSLGNEDAQVSRSPSPLKSPLKLPCSGWSAETPSAVARDQVAALPVVPALGSEIVARLTALDAALRVDMTEVGMVVANLLNLTAFIDTFLTSLMRWVVDSFHLMRKQLDAQTKMIERKDELIRRFTHHRQESAKKQAPAKFRECSVRPLL